MCYIIKKKDKKPNAVSPFEETNCQEIICNVNRKSNPIYSGFEPQYRIGNYNSNEYNHLSKNNNEYENINNNNINRIEINETYFTTNIPNRSTYFNDIYSTN